MTNEFNLPPEQLEQAAKTESAAALQALAQENGIPLTAEEAAEYYTQLHSNAGAISDEELDNVSGGGCVPPPDAVTPKPDKCRVCKGTNFVQEDIYILGCEVKRWICQNCQNFS